MNWGETLCGVKVTPESWAGGIVVDYSGKWWQALINPGKNGKPKKHREWLMESHSADFGGRYLPYFTDGPPGYKTRADQKPPERWEFEPIFPPKGWADKTDAELWAAVNEHNGVMEIAAVNTRKGCIEVDVSSGGNIGIEVSDGYTTMYAEQDKKAPAALILALQNAQVLARRLA